MSWLESLFVIFIDVREFVTFRIGGVAGGIALGIDLTARLTRGARAGGATL